MSEGTFKTPEMPPLTAKAFLKPSPKEKPTKSETAPEAAPVQKPEETEKKMVESGPAKNVPDAPPLEYTPPPWACEPTPGLGYKLEILKNGAIVNVQDMEQRKHNISFIVVGRLPNCDVIMEHPSVSRYHCILQYGDDKMDKKGKGWFIYDMGSTHGTKMNKNRLPAKQYIRIQVGFVFQFGNSTRICSLIGPPEDADPEWDCSPTEMREKMKQKAFKAKLAAAARKEIQEDMKREEEEDEGINWGMDYGEEMGGSSMFDADNFDEEGEAYYYADPKKALAKFFERVGFEMNFTYAESGAGHTHKWTCSIELPVEVDGIDRACTAQAICSTSKKDATVQCALEACRLLDRHGVLRGGSSRVRMKKKNLEENDFYDEDDDLYFDRTGQLELQRDKRKMWTMKAMGKATDEIDTYETLTVKLAATREQMAEIQQELDQLGRNKAEGQAADVDEYVNKLAKGNITVKDDMQTKIHKSTLRQKLVTLTHEAQTLEKLVKIAKPVSLPEIKASGSSTADANKQAFLRKMMKFGNVKKELSNVESKAAAAQKEERVEPVPLFKEKKEADVPVKVKDAVKEEDSGKIKNSSVKSASPPVVETNEASTSFEPTLPVVTKEDRIETSVEPSAEVQQSEAAEDVDAVKGKRVADREEMPTVEKKKRKPHIRKGDKWEEYGAGCELKDEQYATWMPPENQMGDGKTSLNDKFAGRY